jgi:hypothetical protein
MPFKKYVDLEPIRRLRNEGRELLGEIVTLTEKRDGSNISIWLDEDDEPHISSRRLEEASSDLQHRMKLTPEWPRVVEMLRNERCYNNDFVAYGELLSEVSPTRVEPRRKHIHWIMFDMWNVNLQRFEAYDYVYQRGYQFKIPVVRVIDEVSPSTLKELKECVEKTLKWCRRHHREGFVGKAYFAEGQPFFKERIDLPKRPKLARKHASRPRYPDMPEERILRALQHAYDEVGAENWSDKAKAMPVFARHIAVEAEEHNYSRPRNIYRYYIETPIEKTTGLEV